MKLNSYEVRFIKADLVRDIQRYINREGIPLNNRVRQFRTELGLTQKDLAEKANVSTRTIISLEKGTYKPSILLAYKLSLIFGESMEKIFDLYENLQLEERKK